jgi:voltage-gated potassium channel
VEHSSAQSTAEDLEDPRGRLRSYTARTQTPLDLLALATLWIVVVPPGDFGSADHASTIALAVRLALSAIYALDMVIRSSLARRHLHYVATHPLGVLVVLLPPLRVLFSLQLIRSIFRRGHLERFLLAASVLVFEGALVVYFFERHAHGSNIRTVGQAVWWSIVTVTTVGYGDFFPVTPQGRVTAVFIMFIGILTLAVVTAQVAAMFAGQAKRRPGRQIGGDHEPAEANAAREDDGFIGPERLADLERRLERIENLVSATAASLAAMSRDAGEDA